MALEDLKKRLRKPLMVRTHLTLARRDIMELERLAGQLGVTRSVVVGELIQEAAAKTPPAPIKKGPRQRRA